MNIIRFCTLFFCLVLLAFIGFSCMAMGAAPVPRPHQKHPKQHSHPEKIVVRLGKPYIAEKLNLELHAVKK